MATTPGLRFKEISDDLIAQIEAGTLSVGAMFASERVLQDAYSVSRTTIRRALAEVVTQGYGEVVPHRGVVIAKPPRAERLRIAAFIDDAHSVHRSLFFALSQRLSDIGYRLVHVDSTHCGTVGAIEEAARQDYAAAFVWSKNAFLKPGVLDGVKTLMPIIAVDHGMGGEETDLVISDHQGGAELAVGHLLDMGRTNIALTGFYTSCEDIQQRINGYMTAHFTRSMIPLARNLVFSSPAVDAYCEDPQLLISRLQSNDRPDAVFVLHDMSVAPIVEVIVALGLRIPEDVAVVSFGNDVPFEFAGFGLSTIAMHWIQVAESLVERMQARIAAPMAPFRRVILPVRLVVRGSCGAPQDRWMGDPFEPSSMTILSRMKISSRTESPAPDAPSRPRMLTPRTTLRKRSSKPVLAENPH